MWGFNSSAGALISNRTFSAPVGWSAKTVTQGPDNRTYLLPVHNDKRAYLWRLGADLLIEKATLYGPFAGYQAVDLAGESANLRLLWALDDGRAAVWFVNGEGANVAGQLFTGAGYAPRRVSVGDADGKTRLLWNGETGNSALWLIRNDLSLDTIGVFGPR